ncbi:hypothetical protein CALCODRAFT_520153 [Calocera cornea HHB12733]|uniref:C2H2-type domain-containing protein n=1 Tax=Calocera cornea HHB12733 TaxID=1353952 RepID=A0A165DQM8_9BASI|nr:hypothetical protein CALCODRAFT_520153 [Calocera cornea HHB12733]
MSGPNQGYSTSRDGTVSGRAAIQGMAPPDNAPTMVDPAMARMWKEIEERQRQEIESLMEKQRQQRKLFDRAMRQRQQAASQANQPTPPAPVAQLQQQFQSQTVPSQAHPLTPAQIQEIQHQQWINQQLLAAYDQAMSNPQRPSQSGLYQQQTPANGYAGPSHTSVAQQPSLPNPPPQSAPSAYAQQQSPVSAGGTGYWTFPNQYLYPPYSFAPGQSYPPVPQAYWWVPPGASQTSGPPPASTTSTMPATMSQSVAQAQAIVNARAPPNGHSVTRQASSNSLPSRTPASGQTVPQQVFLNPAPSYSNETTTNSIRSSIARMPLSSSSATQAASPSVLQPTTNGRAIDIVLGRSKTSPNRPQPSASGPIHSIQSERPAQTTLFPPARSSNALVNAGRPASTGSISTAPSSLTAQAAGKPLVGSERDLFLQQQAVNIRKFDNLLASKPELLGYINADAELRTVYEAYKQGPLRGEVFDSGHLFHNVLKPIIEQRRQTYAAAQSTQQATSQASQPSTLGPGAALGPPMAAFAPPARASAPPPSTSEPVAKPNGTQPRTDTIAADFLKALELQKKKKRKHDQIDDDSPKSAAPEQLSDSSAELGVPSGPPPIKRAPNSAISRVLNSAEERASSVPVTATEGRPAKRRLAANYNPPPGSLAAKVAAMPDVPVLRLRGHGPRATSVVPGNTTSAHAVESSGVMSVPPAYDFFPDDPLLQAAPYSGQPTAVPTLPTMLLAPQALAPVAPETAPIAERHFSPIPIVHAGPPSGILQGVPIVAYAPPLVPPFSTSSVAPQDGNTPASGSEMALIPTGAQDVIHSRPSLADTWRDPNVVPKLYPPPKGLTVEVVIPVSRAALLKTKEAKMRAEANANPWPHPQDRLHDLECQWGDCEALLDSSKRLKAHVLKNHIQTSEDLICKWGFCGAERDSLPRLEMHVHKKHLGAYTYLCPYEACSRSSPTEAAWRSHMSLHHPKEDRILRPLARPAPLRFSTPIPPLPEHPVPPHEVLFLPVRQSPINADFHRELGPWVLRRILGEVRRGQPRSSTAMALSPVKGQVETDSSPPPREHSPIWEPTLSDDPASLPLARYRYAFLNGNTHQIVNRHAPMELDDLVREEGNGEQQNFTSPNSEPAIASHVQSGLRAPSAASINMHSNPPPALPLFLPDEEEEQQQTPLFLPDTPNAPLSPPASPGEPLFLPDEDEEDELNIRPGLSDRRSHYRRIRNLHLPVASFDSDDEEVELGL